MKSRPFWSVLFSFSVIVLMLFGVQTWKVEAETEAAKISVGAETKSGPSSLNVILLNNQGYKKKRKGPVEFTHKKHVYDYRIFCWNCHHDYNKDGQNVWLPWGETKRCDQCHDPQKNEPNKIMLQKAFHYQCKGCHRDYAKKMMKTGAYKKCAGCHQKKETK